MALTQEQIKHIAKLAALHLDEADVEKYSKDLNSIVGYIDILNSVPAEKLKGAHEHIEKILPLRKDEVIVNKSPTREELLACSPKKVVSHQIAIGNIME